MTTIVCKDGVMMGDTQATRAKWFFSHTVNTKLFKVHNCLCGVAGDISGFNAFQRLLKHVNIKDILNDNISFGLYDSKKIQKYLNKLYKHCSILILTDDNKIYELQNMGFYEINKSYSAVGSGSVVAKTAIHLGHSLKVAMKTASDLDVYTGSKTTTIKLDKK